MEQTIQDFETAPNDIAQKWLIATSPDIFFWNPQLIARQKCYCLNFVKDVYYFYSFNIVIRFFWRKYYCTWLAVPYELSVS